MALSNSNNYTSIQLLPDDQKFNGENFVSFKVVILPTRRLKGLNLYWEGRVIDPHNLPTPYSSTAATTAINDLRPNILEFEIRESVAYLTLWNNIKNPDGLGIPHGLTSKDLWKYLEDEFEQTSEISRQRKEDCL
ncbi:hypothetical protein L218DRAFT_261278 [Marasmius fiardii PR-910]|nr:hypothetical protein L218DRAFT_261278 [Marasmius fiardii PR-910]